MTIIHSGRQYFGMVRILEASGQMLVQLRSDFEYGTLWAHDSLGRRAVSDVRVEEGWWETRMRFGNASQVEIATRQAGQSEFGDAWGVVQLTPGGAYDIMDEVNPDLVGKAQQAGVIAAIVIALGDRGALYINRIEIRT